MGFVQKAMTCQDATALGCDPLPVHATEEPDPNCCVIVGLQDGVIVWHSHAPNDIDPKERANPDYPLEV